MTHTTAALTNQTMDQSRDAEHLDIASPALEKSRLLDISSVEENQEESKSANDISEFSEKSEGHVHRELVRISPVNNYKQAIFAGYTAMIDTLQIYGSEGIQPLDMQTDEQEGISPLSMDEVPMSKEELAIIRQAAWTEMDNSLKI